MGGQRWGGGRGWLAGDFREHWAWRRLSLLVSLLGLGNPRLVGWCMLSSSRAQAARPGPARPRLALQARACAPVTVSCALCPLAPGWSLLHWVGVPALLGGDLVPAPS